LVIEDDQAGARKLAQAAKATFPVMSDRVPRPGSESTVHDRYGVSYGTVCLLDSSRTVRWAFFGSKERRVRVQVTLRQVRRMLTQDGQPQAVERALEQLQRTSPAAAGVAALRQLVQDPEQAVRGFGTFLARRWRSRLGRVR